MEKAEIVLKRECSLIVAHPKMKFFEWKEWNKRLWDKFSESLKAGNGNAVVSHSTRISGDLFTVEDGGKVIAKYYYARVTGWLAMYNDYITGVTTWYNSDEETGIPVKISNSDGKYFEIVFDDAGSFSEIKKINERKWEEL